MDRLFTFHANAIVRDPVLGDALRIRLVARLQQGADILRWFIKIYITKKVCCVH